MLDGNCTLPVIAWSHGSLVNPQREKIWGLIATRDDDVFDCSQVKVIMETCGPHLSVSNQEITHRVREIKNMKSFKYKPDTACLTNSS